MGCGPQAEDMTRSAMGVWRSKVKVTGGQNRSQKSLSTKFLKNNLTNFNQTWQAHITVNANCVTTT